MMPKPDEWTQGNVCWVGSGVRGGSWLTERLCALNLLLSPPPAGSLQEELGSVLCPES